MITAEGSITYRVSASIMGHFYPAKTILQRLLLWYVYLRTYTMVVYLVHIPSHRNVFTLVPLIDQALETQECVMLIMFVINNISEAVQNSGHIKVKSHVGYPTRDYTRV